MHNQSSRTSVCDRIVTTCRTKPVFHLLLVSIPLILSKAASIPVYGQEPKPPLEGPRYIAYDHNNVIHLFDRLGELKPPGEGDEHPHIPQHFEKSIHATVSGNCEFIAFSAKRPPQSRHYDVYVWDRKAKHVLTLPGANSPADDEYPSISADGNLIAFHTRDPASAK